LVNINHWLVVYSLLRLLWTLWALFFKGLTFSFALGFFWNRWFPHICSQLLFNKSIINFWFLKAYKLDKLWNLELNIFENTPFNVKNKNFNTIIVNRHDKFTLKILTMYSRIIPYYIVLTYNIKIKIYLSLKTLNYFKKFN